MRLPINIFLLTKKYFKCHGCWHEMRSPSVPKKDRERCFPGLRALGEPGAGEDFLRFHREMVRNFKWLIKNAEGPKYDYVQWNHFPNWLEGLLDAFRPPYRRQLRRALEKLVDQPKLDELGVFIEGGGLKDNFPAIHWMVHGIVSDFERVNFGSQPAADMGKMETSPNNEHFWGLHGWIDNLYASWQTNNGESVDQSALKPHAPKMCEPCQHLRATEFGLPSNRWKKYLSKISR
jgi:hypothetical protein